MKVYRVLCSPGPPKQDGALIIMEAGRGTVAKWRSKDTKEGSGRWGRLHRSVEDWRR